MIDVLERAGDDGGIRISQLRNVDVMVLTPSTQTQRSSLSAGEITHPAVPDDSQFLENQLLAVWEKIFDGRTIGIHDDFFACGGHSLMAVRLIVQIERAFGIKLPMAVFYEAPTVAGMAAAIVFFLGDIGGGGLYLRRFLDHLGDRTWYAIPPHNLDDAKTMTTVGAMAADRLALLRRHGIAPPYDLIGYCNGALVAFEAGRQLAADGYPVRVLAIDGELLPAADRRLLDYARDLFIRCGVAESVARERLLRAWERVQEIRRSKRLGIRTALRARFRRAAPIARSATETSEIVEILRNRAVWYRPKRYSVQLHLLLAEDEPANHGRRRTAWEALAPASIDLVPGNHHTCVSEHANAIARRMGELLDA